MFRTSWALFAFALLALGAAVAAIASEDGADGEMHSLDSVDDGRTHSLDSADGGRTHSLDSADDGRTHSLDSADDGRTHSLDSTDDGRMHSLDSADTGHTLGLDHAEALGRESSPPPAPAPEAFPPIVDGDWEAQARRAKQQIADAEQRLQDANHAYSEMMARDYPRGEARQQIIDARRAAVAHLGDAQDYYRRVERRAREAGRPL